MYCAEGFPLTDAQSRLPIITRKTVFSDPLVPPSLPPSLPPSASPLAPSRGAPESPASEPESTRPASPAPPPSVIDVPASGLVTPDPSPEPHPAATPKTARMLNRFSKRTVLPPRQDRKSTRLNSSHSQ